VAAIAPFRGFRFVLKDPDDLALFIAPPYDMLNDKKVDELYDKSLLNAVRIDQNRALTSDKSNRDRHVRASHLFDDWVRRGLVIADDRPSLYVYEQQFSIEQAGVVRHFNRTGVVSLVKLVDFSENVVLPHEYTLSGPKADRYEHLDATRLNVGQIFGLLSDERGAVFELIKRMKKEPALGSAVDGDGVCHELYACDDPVLIGQFTAAAKSESILIADGHHRYETGLNYYREHGNDPALSHTMMTLVSMADPGLVIRSFHRLIRKQKQALDMPKELGNSFSVADIGPASLEIVNRFLGGDLDAAMLFVDSASGHAFGLTLNASGEAFLQSTLPERSVGWKHLDMSVINMIAVNRILKLPLDGHVLHDVINYMNDAAAALTASLNPQEYYGGFFIRPVDIEAIHRIVQGGERMPQKSTNFYPKLYSGLVFNRVGPT
jgi:uncharacterized protein (DUF1015 family)